jgi:hypothetical protein
MGSGMYTFINAYFYRGKVKGKGEGGGKMKRKQGLLFVPAFASFQGTGDLFFKF